MSLRTPLARVRGLGSAKDGTEHWWLQRVTAIALVPLVLIFTGYVIYLAGADHATAAAALGSPFGALVALLTVVTLFYHLRLGLQVVIEDYVSAEGAKIAVLLFSNFFCIVVGLACVLAVLKLAFGG
jgi:succinate dehydrogenase / fumarate reductase membrane anchor subunit